MKEVAGLLRQEGLSFRKVVQQIESRELLLPTKVGATIQLMDSETLSEAENALRGARRLMMSLGLTFAQIIKAFENESAASDENEWRSRARRADAAPRSASCGERKRTVSTGTSGRH
jgi:hypothetical protein